MVILVIAGLWALVAGRLTLSPSLRLHGRVARFYGLVLALYAVFLHPILVLLLLKWLTISLSGDRTGSTIGLYIANLALAVAVLFGLAKLVMRFFPSELGGQPKSEPTVSPGFLITAGLLIAFAVGGYYWVAFGRHVHIPPPAVPSILTSSPAATSSAPNGERDLSWIGQEVTLRMKNSTVISSDIGTPVKVFPIPQSQVIPSSHGTIMEYSLVGPRGKGHCQTLFVPASSSVDKKEHFALFWTFNGQKKTLSVD